MYTSEQLDILLQEAMAGLGMNNNNKDSNINNRKNTHNKNVKSNIPAQCQLTPAQALVIAGLLGGSLNVFSVLVDADQTISIVLRGSLKRKSNNDQLDQILSQLGKVPFDDIVAAMVRRLKL